MLLRPCGPCANVQFHMRYWRLTIIYVMTDLFGYGESFVGKAEYSHQIFDRLAFINVTAPL